MPSLRDLARKVIADAEVEQPLEHGVEQVEQRTTVFQMPVARSMPVEQDLAEVSAKNQACSTVPPSRARNGGTLPIAITNGLASLKAMAAPRITRPEVWPVIVADALRLYREGWAERALALGWHPLELFGHGVESGHQFEGLAVWLGGRRIVLLDGDSAMVADGPGRHLFNRRSDFPDLVERGLIVPLWQFGEARQKGR